MKHLLNYGLNPTGKRFNIMIIPYGKQEITSDDISAILKVLQSDFLTQGPEINIFEKNVSNYVGADFGISFNSATSALHSACAVVGLRSSDILWTSPISLSLVQIVEFIVALI